MENFLQKIMFRKNSLKDCITGVQGEAIKKTQVRNSLHKKSLPQKNIPNIVSLIVHRKNNKKQN